MNLEEAIGEYEFLAVPRSLFPSDGTLLLPSDKYELMKQTENIAVPNPQNMDENMDDVAQKLRVTCA